MSAGAQIVALREARGLSQEQFALELGLSSKGYISRIENGEPPSLETALQIQVWSGGKVLASDLRPDKADLIAAIAAQTGAAPAEAAA